MKTILAASALFLLSGCGHPLPSWRLPDPPSEETRRRLGRVAVALGDDGPPDVPVPPLASTCESVALGSLEGMGRGALAGLSVLMVPVRTGDSHANACLMTFQLLLGLAVGAVGMPVGAIAGAAGAPASPVTAEEIDLWRGNFREALARPGLREGIRDALETELRRGGDVVLAAAGEADTLLVLDPPRGALAGPHSANPQLRLYGEMSFRLRRADDPAPFHAITLGFAGGVAPFSSWAARGPDLLESDLREGMDGFARRAVEELFRIETPARP